MKEFLSPKQVARAVGVSESSLKRWCDGGRLPTVRTAGGHRRLPVGGVIQFLRDNGYTPLRPEILGLPANLGGADTTLDDMVLPAAEALEVGDAEGFRRATFCLYLAGHPAVDIFDRVMAPAFRTIGERWAHGDIEVYQERRGVEITMRTLLELRLAIPSPSPQKAPLATGGTLAQDYYTLPTTMAEVALREAGWHAQSLGTNNPADTLRAAIRDTAPALFWLSVSHIEDNATFLDQYHAVFADAADQGTAMAVGGRALRGELRENMRYAAYCDTIGHLISFADTLRRAKQGEISQITPARRQSAPLSQ